MEPFPNRKNGRDNGGHFAKGNKAAVAHAAPHAARVACLRAALLDAVTAADVTAIAKALIAKARAGDLRAAREVLDRTLGMPERTAWTLDNLAAADKTATAQAQALEWDSLSDEERLLKTLESDRHLRAAVTGR